MSIVSYTTDMVKCRADVLALQVRHQKSAPEARRLPTSDWSCDPWRRAAIAAGAPHDWPDPLHGRKRPVHMGPADRADRCQLADTPTCATGGRARFCLVRQTLRLSRARAATGQETPSSARTPEPNWRATVVAAAAAVLCCCTRPWNHGLGASNYASDLGWSYGDSNPGPLACHESLASPATRPYAA